MKYTSYEVYFTNQSKRKGVGMSKLLKLSFVGIAVIIFGIFLMGKGGMAHK